MFYLFVYFQSKTFILYVHRCERKGKKYTPINVGFLFSLYSFIQWSVKKHFGPLFANMGALKHPFYFFFFVRQLSASLSGKLTKGFTLNITLFKRHNIQISWKSKSKVVPVVGTLGTVIQILEDWLKQIPGTTSAVSLLCCMKSRGRTQCRTQRQRN